MPLLMPDRRLGISVVERGTMDLIWRTGVAATDAWAGSLEGALVASDTMRVTHLVVKRGLLLSTRFVAPFERLARGDHQGLYLDIPIAEVLGLPKLRGLHEDPSQVALTPRTHILLADGSQLRLKGLRLSQGVPSLTRLVVGRAGRVSFLLALDKVIELGISNITVGIGQGELSSLPTYRLDEGIDEDLWEALCAAEGISDTDLEGVRVQVVDGLATLEGNVRTSSAVAAAEGTAWAVNGVADVKNRLISDWDIELAVASYISRESPGLSGHIVVHIQLGRVTLEGNLPPKSDKNKIIDGVSSIPGVLSVEYMTGVGPLASIAVEDAPQ